MESVKLGETQDELKRSCIRLLCDKSTESACIMNENRRRRAKIKGKMCVRISEPLSLSPIDYSMFYLCQIVIDPDTENLLTHPTTLPINLKSTLFSLSSPLKGIAWAKGKRPN
jgi:hypothetical protein